jgi:cyanophycinase
MFRYFAFLVVLALPPLVLGDDARAQRLDPAGLAGNLLICGSAAPSDALALKMLELGGGAKARVLLLHADKTPPQEPARRLRAAADKFGATFDAAPMVSLAPAQGERDHPTCVWLAAGGAHKSATAFCRDVLGKQGVIALGRDSLAAAASLLPDCEVTLDKKAPPPAGAVGFVIPPAATLWIQGRNVRGLSAEDGVGDAAIEIRLRASQTLPARTLTLQGQAIEDLTALRRAAAARNGSPFPPLSPRVPHVPRGTLFIVGGGGTPAGLVNQFVEAAKEAGKSHLVILPTAQPDPIPNRSALVDVFKKAGAAKVTILNGRTLADVESEAYLDALRDATGIWFDGGRQWRFIDAYEGTKAHALMFDVLNRGGVIGGTSAGATIQGEYLCRGSPFGNLDIRYEGYERGLGFLPGVAIDQHFSQRKRFADMTALMKIYPQLLGIGIDEATALVVRGHVASIIGKGKAYFYDRTQPARDGELDYIALGDGDRYDLQARKAVIDRK